MDMGLHEGIHQGIGNITRRAPVSTLTCPAGNLVLTLPHVNWRRAKMREGGQG